MTALLKNIFSKPRYGLFSVLRTTLMSCSITVCVFLSLHRIYENIICAQ